jgi:DNA repair protein RecO (recombination protein O)
VQIRDSGFILDKQTLGENSLLITIFSQNHGLIKGAVNNIKSKNIARIIAQGNHIEFCWKARLLNHLGTLTLELERPLSFKIFADQLKILMLQSILSTLSVALPEGVSEQILYTETANFINTLAANKEAMLQYIYLELSMLSTLGFELDLKNCALTDYIGQLYYLSPKTGRGAIEEAGIAHHDKLFVIPDYFYNAKAISIAEFYEGIKITHHFLVKNIFSEKRLMPPASRTNLMQFLARSVTLEATHDFYSS